MEKLINLSNLLLCMVYKVNDKAVLIEQMKQFSKLQALLKTNSMKVFNDNEIAIELFDENGVPGSFIDI